MAGFLLGFPSPLDGMSAYDVAVAAGFVGTEAQWLASLEGSQGPQGPGGPQGPAGGTGGQGPQGPQGPAAVNPVINVVTLNPETLYTTFPQTFPYNGSGKPIFLVVAVTVYGGANTATVVNATWKNANDVTLKGPTMVAGANINSGTDGGSALTNAHMVTIPWLENAKKIVFTVSGNPLGASMRLISILETGQPSNTIVSTPGVL